MNGEHEAPGGERQAFTNDLIIGSMTEWILTASLHL